MLRTSAVLALVILLVGCGEPYAVPALSPDSHWHADPRPQVREWGLYQKEYVEFILPEARHAGEDAEGETQRLLVNVLGNGDVLFKGNLWPLRSASDEERGRALRAFAKEMTLLTDNQELREEDGSSRIPFMFHAAREAGWRHVRALWLLAIRDPAIRMRLFQVPVWSGTHLHADTRFDVRAEDGFLPSGDVLALELTATDGADRPSIELRVEEERWSFGELPEAPHADGAYLARANAVWADAEAALESHAQPDAPVALRIAVGEQELPWAFVVKVLDLLLGAGVRDVYLVEEGLHLGLEQPPEARTYRRVDAPIVTPLVLVLCALAVALAFWIAFRPLRSPRKA